MAKNSNHEMWRSRIMGITDRKLLEYIQDQCRIRLDIARADHNITKPEPKKSNKDPYSITHEPPRKLKPIKMSAPKEEDEEQYY